MQVPQQSRMGEAQNNLAEYICGYIDNNELGEKGCRNLSKAAWGDLQEIRRGYSSLTKSLTKSGTGAAGTLAGEAGCE